VTGGFSRLLALICVGWGVVIPRRCDLYQDRISRRIRLDRAPSAAFRVDAISAVEQVWIRGIHVAERQERDAEAADRGEDTV
jgi:hypothetical protein